MTRWWGMSVSLAGSGSGSRLHVPWQGAPSTTAVPFETSRALEVIISEVKKPRILILDEAERGGHLSAKCQATSALDSGTEAAVQKSVNAYLKQRLASCLVIAHRLSTVMDVDKIVVLDQGLIAEQGKHQALMRKNGIYANLAGSSRKLH